MSLFHYGTPTLQHDKHKSLLDSEHYTVLDINAGYRSIWRTTLRNHYYGNVLFIDIRREVKPDILCSNEQLPFKNGTFKTVVYDPPFITKHNPNGTYYKTEFGKRWWSSKSKSSLLHNVAAVNKEAARVAENLILKWTDTEVALNTALALLDKWHLVKQRFHRSKHASKTSARTTSLSFLSRIV